MLGAPDLLLGKPLVADPFMPAVATGAQSVAFGDFSQFFVRLSAGSASSGPTTSPSPRTW